MDDSQELISLLGPNQRLIILQRQGSKWRRACASDGDWDFSAGSVRSLILQEAERSRSGVMIMDSERDERLAASQGQRPFRSAVCCPVIASWGLAGFLYVEDTKSVRAFTFEQMSAWAERAGSLQLVASPPAAAPVDPARLWGVRLAGVAMLALLIPVWGATRASRPRPVPPAGPALSSRQTASAATIAGSFLMALNGGNLAGAYRLLSQQRQSESPEVSFTVRAKKWLSVSERAWGLKFRQIQVVQAGPSHCRVKVVPTGLASKQESWTWDLIREEGGWRIHDAI